MMKWVIISEDYLSYLRSLEPRIPNSKYGRYRFKPFFGGLFETDGMWYVTQVSSVKERHKRMKQSMDFLKIHEKKTDKLIAVINLNYMFLVPKSEFKYLEYNEIEEYREFSSEKEKSQYIHFLKKEISLINELNVEAAAKKLYDLKNKYPENVIAERCIEFKELEKGAREYEKCADWRID